MRTVREALNEILGGLVRKADTDSGSVSVVSEGDVLKIDVSKYRFLGLGLKNTGAGTASCTVIGYVVAGIGSTIDSFDLAGGDERVTVADVYGYSSVVIHVLPNGDVNLEFEWVRKA